MRLQYPTLFSAAVLSVLVTPKVFADPGVLDRFDCHDHAETGQYHCHGNSALASLGGVAIGAGLRSSVWTYQGENAVNIFTGPSIEAEAGLGAFAVQAAYHYKTLVKGDDDINLVGWDVGIKAGRSVARYGAKYYIAGGYFFESLRRPDEENYPISGFYLGLGTGYNWDNFGADIQLDWHNSAGYENYWEDQNDPVKMQTIALRTYLTYRF